LVASFSRRLKNWEDGREGSRAEEGIVKLNANNPEFTVG